MAEKKIIAVVGATGAQGGGLVRAILNDKNGGFTVRAITRDVQSDKAKGLAALGAEVVAANLDSPESLKKAFAGSIRSILSDELLGAPLTGERVCPGQSSGAGCEGHRGSACNLVYPGRHTQVGAAQR